MNKTKSKIKKILLLVAFISAIYVILIITASVFDCPDFVFYLLMFVALSTIGIVTNISSRNDEIKLSKRGKTTIFIGLLVSILLLGISILFEEKIKETSYGVFVFSNDTAFVYKLLTEEPQMFEKKSVQIGLSDGIKIQIKEGLAEKDKIRGTEIIEKKK